MYNITIGRTKTPVKQCSNEQEAIDFIMEKLREDIRFKIKATYYLYEGADFLREYTQSAVETQTSSAEDTAGSSQQKGSGQSFRPSPFATTPRIGPQSHLKNDSNEDKKDDQK